MLKVREGDEVKVLVGKDKNKTGKVISVNPKEQTVIIENINVKKKTIKGTNEEPGKIVDVPSPIDWSNVAVLLDGKISRIGIEVKDGKKIRVHKKTGKQLK